MHNHGFDNIVLMCGMYENESLALRTVLKQNDNKDVISYLNTHLSLLKSTEINVTQRIKCHEILMLLCRCSHTQKGSQKKRENGKW
jgi:hypothetical protein